MTIIKLLKFELCRNKKENSRNFSKTLNKFAEKEHRNLY
jgi:hypothetical protein